MNRRTLIVIILAVAALHGLFFWLVSGSNPLPKTTFIPPPNFVAKEAAWSDAQTGEHGTYREYKVSTQLAMPDALAAPKSASP
jgi:hypothetical protein